MKKISIVLSLLILLSSIFVNPVFAESPSTWAQQEVDELKATQYFDNSSFT